MDLNNYDFLSSVINGQNLELVSLSVNGDEMWPGNGVSFTMIDGSHRKIPFKKTTSEYELDLDDEYQRRKICDEVSSIKQIKVTNDNISAIAIGGCDNLEKVDLNKVKVLMVMSGNDKLSSINLSSVEEIWPYAMIFNPTLSDVGSLDNLKTLWWRTFHDSGLTSITITGDISCPSERTQGTIVDDYLYDVFTRCHKLVSADIRNPKYGIGIGCFTDCSSLEYIRLDNADCIVTGSRNNISKGKNTLRNTINLKVIDFSNRTKNTIPDIDENIRFINDENMYLNNVSVLVPDLSVDVWKQAWSKMGNVEFQGVIPYYKVGKFPSLQTQIHDTSKNGYWYVKSGLLGSSNVRFEYDDSVSGFMLDGILLKYDSDNSRWILSVGDDSFTEEGTSQQEQLSITYGEGKVLELFWDISKIQQVSDGYWYQYVLSDCEGEQCQVETGYYLSNEQNSGVLWTGEISGVTFRLDVLPFDRQWTLSSSIGNQIVLQKYSSSRPLNFEIGQQKYDFIWKSM